MREWKKKSSRKKLNQFLKENALLTGTELVLPRTMNVGSREDLKKYVCKIWIFKNIRKTKSEPMRPLR